MSKGSGRRRITPSDGIHYDDDTMMTNIEDRGGKAFMSPHQEISRGFRTGAQPTAHNDYGSHSGTGTNGRYGGRGRKNDFRNWKGYTKGKQYEHNLTSEEGKSERKPLPEGVARRMREKSLNALSHEGRKFAPFNPSRDYGSYAEYRHRSPSLWKRPDPPLMKLGFAIFEEKVRRIELHVKYGY